MTSIKSLTFELTTKSKSTLSHATTCTKTHIVGFSGPSLLSTINQALTQKTDDFLNQPQVQLNGQTYTGLDLLKTLHEMSSKEGNRSWADGSGSAVGITFLLGLPLMSKAIRKDFFELWRKGLPTHHFHKKLQLFKTLQGDPCQPTLIIHELISQNLMSESTGRYVLTKEGLQRLKQEKAKILYSKMAPTLSRIATQSKADEN